MNIARCIVCSRFFSPCPKSICNAYVKRNVNTGHFFVFFFVVVEESSTHTPTVHIMDALSECAKMQCIVLSFLCYCDGICHLLWQRMKKKLSLWSRCLCHFCINNLFHFEVQFKRCTNKFMFFSAYYSSSHRFFVCVCVVVACFYREIAMVKRHKFSAKNISPHIRWIYELNRFSFGVFLLSFHDKWGYFIGSALLALIVCSVSLPFPKSEYHMNSQSNAQSVVAIRRHLITDFFAPKSIDQYLWSKLKKKKKKT